MSYPDLNARAWKAWSAAWDRAREYDRRHGRRYDKERYAEAAHNARMEVLAGESESDAAQEELPL